MTDLAELTSWHSDWTKSRVLVYGLGVTGFSVADTLAELGSEVLVVAAKADPEQVDILDVLGVKVQLESDPAKQVAILEDYRPTLVITSPGVEPKQLFIQQVQNIGIPLWRTLI